MHRESTATRTAQSGQFTSQILGAVADVRDCSVEDLDTRLYDVIDPDCLERLFSPRANGASRSDGRVVFTVENCEVTVRSDGRITATHRPTPDAGANQVAATNE